MNDCCFCVSDQRSAIALKRRIGWEDDDFFVTPSLGPIAPTHLLLIPKRHLASFAQLAPPHRESAEGIIKQHAALLSNSDKNIVVFEHGMADHLGTGGGCGISHAHVHLLALPRNVVLPPLPEPDERGGWFSLPPGSCLPQEAPESGYLLIGFRGKFQMRPVASIPSQYLRRWFAELVGKRNWDWRQAPVNLDQQVKELRRLHLFSRIAA